MLKRHNDKVEIIPVSTGKSKEPEKQSLLFSDEETLAWKKEWQGMPEFVSEDLTPFQTVSICFLTTTDREAFANLIGQKITGKTKSLWFPKDDFKRHRTDIEYADEK